MKRPLAARPAAGPETGGPAGFPLESATVWNLRGLAPESTRLLAVAPVLALAALGVAACGPSNGGTPATYTIVFSLSATPDDTDLGNLTYRVGYDSGDFSGEGASVVCSLVADADGETADFTDDDNGELTIVIDATENALIVGEDIVECEFVATTQPTADTFPITVDSAKDDFGDPVDKNAVDVVVTSTDLK